MRFGSGDTVASTHSTRPSRSTRHSPGPGTWPVTVIVASSVTSARGAATAVAPAAIAGLLKMASAAHSGSRRNDAIDGSRGLVRRRRSAPQQEIQQVVLEIRIDGQLVVTLAQE